MFTIDKRKQREAGCVNCDVEVDFSMFAQYLGFVIVQESLPPTLFQIQPWRLKFPNFDKTLDEAP